MADQPEPPQDFASLFAAYEREQATKQPSKPARGGPQPGEKVTGRIVGFGEQSAFVDLGGKSEGVIPLFEVTDADGARTHAIGDEVEALVASVGADGVVLRLRAGAGGQATPAELAQAREHGLPVEGTVTAAIKGGVEVTVAGVRAFCPISQLDDRFVEDAAAYVGRRLAFRITRLEEGRGRGPNVVLSRRALLAEEARERAAVVLATLAPGKVVHGTVTSLASYGAFVDLGGVEGLLHVSELGHGRVGHPQEVLAVGQEIEVQVLRIEAPRTEAAAGGKPARERGERISLSRRSLLADPWQEAVARFAVGSRHTGRVARLETFGAFVELAPGIDGLLHVSELGGGKPIRHPREAVRPGDSVAVAVRAVDRERKRISLVMAGAHAEEADEQAAAAQASAEPPGFGALGDFLSRKK